MRDQAFTPTKVTHRQDFKLLLEAVVLLEIMDQAYDDPVVSAFLTKPEIKRIRGVV